MAPASPDAIKGRIEMIKRQIDETDSDFDREKLQERLAKLSGGVAVIQVGAATELSSREEASHRGRALGNASGASSARRRMRSGASSPRGVLSSLEKIVELLGSALMNGDATADHALESRAGRQQRVLERCLRSFSSTSVAAPTSMTATLPASFAEPSCAFSRSQSLFASSSILTLDLLRRGPRLLRNRRGPR